MPDYQNGKIYMLTTQKNCKVYIGSTTTTLYSRFQSHQSCIKRWLEGIGKKYKSAFELLEYDDCKIELIEDYPCESLKKLTTREGYHMMLNKDFIVNKCIAGRTKKEFQKDYYNKNKQTMKEDRKKYFEAHKDEIKKNRHKKYMCMVCNKEITVEYRSKHEKTATHIKNYNSLHPVSV